MLLTNRKRPSPSGRIFQKPTEWPFDSESLRSIDAWSVFHDRGRARMCVTGMPKVPVLHAGQNLFLKWAVPPVKPGVHMLASPRSCAPQHAERSGSSGDISAVCERLCGVPRIAVTPVATCWEGGGGCGALVGAGALAGASLRVAAAASAAKGQISAIRSGTRGTGPQTRGCSVVASAASQQHCRVGLAARGGKQVALVKENDGEKVGFSSSVRLETDQPIFIIYAPETLHENMQCSSPENLLGGNKNQILIRKK